MSDQLPGPGPDLDRIFPGRRFISTILDVLESKQQMSGKWTRVYLQRAAMAGIIAGIFYVANYALIGVFAQYPVPGAHAGQGGDGGEIGRILGGIVFGWALVFIYYTRSELLTSNMMITVVGSYYRRITVLGGLRIMALCFLGNALGGLLIAVALHFSTLIDGATGEQMMHAVEHKLGYLSSLAGAGDLLVRAILCNFMINLAMLLVYNGHIKDDITKSLAMIVSVFLFAFLSFEHSVANTVLFLISGLHSGIDPVAAAGNVGIALIGNFIGGGVLIGFYYAYANDERQLRRHIEHEREEREEAHP